MIFLALFALTEIITLFEFESCKLLSIENIFMLLEYLFIFYHTSAFINAMCDIHMVILSVCLLGTLVHCIKTAKLILMFSSSSHVAPINPATRRSHASQIKPDS